MHCPIHQQYNNGVFKPFSYQTRTPVSRTASNIKQEKHGDEKLKTERSHGSVKCWTDRGVQLKEANLLGGR